MEAAVHSFFVSFPLHPPGNWPRLVEQIRANLVLVAILGIESISENGLSTCNAFPLRGSGISSSSSSATALC